MSSFDVSNDTLKIKWQNGKIQSEKLAYATCKPKVIIERKKWFEKGFDLTRHVGGDFWHLKVKPGSNQNTNSINFHQKPKKQEFIGKIKV